MPTSNGVVGSNSYTVGLAGVWVFDGLNGDVQAENLVTHNVNDRAILTGGASMSSGALLSNAGARGAKVDLTSATAGLKPNSALTAMWRGWRLGAVGGINANRNLVWCETSSSFTTTTWGVNGPFAGTFGGDNLDYLGEIKTTDVLNSGVFSGSTPVILTVSYDSAASLARMRTYVNATPGGTSNSPTSTISYPGTGSSIQFGYNEINGSWNSNVACSWVYLWDRQLTDQEVADIANNPDLIFQTPPPPPPEFFGWWNWWTT